MITPIPHWKQTATAALCLLALGCSGLKAQTDVTTDYLENPSFEADSGKCTAQSTNKVTNSADGLRGWDISPAGWTTATPGVSLLLSADCFTDNNFGKTAPADGRFAFYQRYGWGEGISSSLRQTTRENLPAGDYKLTFQVKAYAANNAATSAFVSINVGGASLGSTTFSCQPGSEGIMASAPWKEQAVRFTLTEAAPVEIAAEMTWGNGGSCIAYDDFRLILLPEGYEEPDTPLISGGTEDQVASPTEGVITADFVGEAQMQQDLLQMLANFTQYAKNIWQDCPSANSRGEACGYFRANSAGQNNEDGVRTNADLSMVCAFLYRYARDKEVLLPEGLTWDEVKSMALKSLVYAYSTHKANKLKTCTNNAYWGSVSTTDYTWESSLWAMSVAYSAYFLDEELSETQKNYIYQLIKAECNYELGRNVPTGYAGDTKAEENGWEADVLACALGLYPDDPLAPRWFQKLREFAINSYSQVDDAQDNTVIDPGFDQQTVQDLYKGKNLYDDYTLQNHNYFHTSYQNVVIQELGEAHLALLLFQGSDNPKWQTNALMHNNQAVMDSVLCWLALADGELAMPNGNDWSMFLYDQITSYSTLACFLRDADALMLENLAYKNIKARQSTTSDGSWLLNSDIGPRRMGVEAHRVMMTYLMHELASTADLQPSSWDDFARRHEAAKLFTTQNIVRALTPERFTIFSWSTGTSSYTGYFAPCNPDNNKIVVPYKANNTGNLLGWYSVSGKGTNASPLVSGVYNLMGNSYTMNGKLLTNDKTLENNFALYSTPGNAFVYLDCVVGKTSGTITREQGGMLAISVDPFTKPQRTLYFQGGRVQTDGAELTEFGSPWVNIDNQIGIATADEANKVAFGDRALSNSVQTARLYPLYAAGNRPFRAEETVDRRHIIYYSNVDSLQTAQLAAGIVALADSLPEGWNGVICPDPDGARYLLLSNFRGESSCALQGIGFPEGAPVFPCATAIEEDCASATFRCDVNHSIGSALRAYVKGSGLLAKQVPGDSCSIYLRNPGERDEEAQVCILRDRAKTEGTVPLPAGSVVLVSAKDGALTCSPIEIPQTEDDFVDITALVLANPSFEEDKTYGTIKNSLALNGVTYAPCYVNSTAAADGKWPQVLPVEGWTAGNGLQAESKYCTLYSMPYSATMYCVSPNNVGNSASIMAEPAFFDSCGERCLNILNSWSTGTNRIFQTVSLPAGEYKLVFLMQYACPNENRRTASAITSTGGNVNRSLCGISYGETEQYVYPSRANCWEKMECPFTLEEKTDVTLSMGLQTSAAVGAAENTRIYADRIQLLHRGEYIPDGLAELLQDEESRPVDVYDLKGLLVRRGVPQQTATQGLAQGTYIVGKKKVLVE